ncbi:MAG: hypothetical protein QM581_07085 [Pseudomonas sp.]
MSTLPAEPLWSDLQLSWLQALGHTVYLDRAAVVTAAAPVVDAAPVREMAVPTTPARRSAPVVPPDVPSEAEPVQRPAMRRGRAGLPDRLQIALLRACGCHPDHPETQRLMASWPLEALRADPAAKRALWPQLRLLRRGAPR